MLLTDEEILEEVKGTELYLDASDNDLIAFAQAVEVRVIQKLNLHRTDISNERVIRLARYYNIDVREDEESELNGRIDKYDLLDFVCAILKETEFKNA